MTKLALRSILVATDLTPASVAVVRAAAALAQRSGAELHLLHAFELPVVPFVFWESEVVGTQSPVDVIARKLEEQAWQVLPEGVTLASCRVVIGSPGQAILDRAEQVRANVIVLGPHRPRTVGDPVLGSTADRVVRTAEVPCLVVRERLELPVRRVLVPIDLAHPARAALREGVGWCRAFGTPAGSGAPAMQLTVIHVIPRVYEMYDFPFDQAVIAPELRKEVDSVLGREDLSGIELREEVVWGDDPGEQIVRVARESRSGLAVMGTHGYGGLVRALIGSVSSHVARSAPCSVLLVPPSLWRGEATARVMEGMAAPIL